MKHRVFREALRACLRSLQKGMTIGDGLSTTPTGYARTTGSFITDGFSRGDEIVASGFSTPAANGTKYIKQLTATTLELVNAAGFSTKIQPGGAKLAAGLPSVKYEGWIREPIVGQPWIRESYKPMSSDRKSIGPAPLIRDEGLWLLDVFYPIDSGTDGLDGMVDALIALFYPGRQLLYSGQAVSIRSSSRAATIEEQSWVMAPMSVRFFANTYNPQ